MRAETLTPVSSVAGPFASLYFDDSHYTEDARRLHELRWRGLRDDLARQGAPESLLGQVDRRMDAAAPGPATRSRGRAIVANGDGILLDAALLHPPGQDVARYSQLPYVLPLVELGEDSGPCLVVSVDQIGADIEVRDGSGAAIRTTAVDGRDWPVHDVGGAGAHRSFKDTQARTEEVVRQNISAAAARVAEVAQETGADPVAVTGEVHARALLLRQLPDAIRRRTAEIDAGSRAAGADRERVDKAVAELLARKRLTLMADEAERFVAESARGSGLALAGAEPVLAALQQAKVEVLLIGDAVARHVSVDAVGGRDHIDGPADEVLPFCAVLTGADIVRVDERLELTDGFGALLRHR